MSRSKQPYVLKKLAGWYCPGQQVGYGQSIRIDEPKETDIPDLICGIYVTIHADDRWELRLTNAGFAERLREVGATHHGTVDGFQITLPLSATDDDAIDDLAQHIAGLVAQGCTEYHDRNWRWIVPRVAKQLRKFARRMRSMAPHLPPTEDEDFSINETEDTYV